MPGPPLLVAADFKKEFQMFSKTGGVSNGFACLILRILLSAILTILLSAIMLKIDSFKTSDLRVISSYISITVELQMMARVSMTGTPLDLGLI